MTHGSELGEVTPHSRQIKGIAVRDPCRMRGSARVEMTDRGRLTFRGKADIHEAVFLAVGAFIISPAHGTGHQLRAKTNAKDGLIRFRRGRG